MFLDKKAPMIMPWLLYLIKISLKCCKISRFFIVFGRMPTSNIMFSVQFEELSFLNKHHLNSIFYTSSPVSCFTEELCKTAVPVGCPALFFLVQALKEVNVSTIKRSVVKASLLSYIVPGAHYPAWHILFEECVVRSSLIRRRISVCSCKEFFT